MRAACPASTSITLSLRPFAGRCNSFSLVLLSGRAARDTSMLENCVLPFGQKRLLGRGIQVAGTFMFKVQPGR